MVTNMKKKCLYVFGIITIVCAVQADEHAATNTSSQSQNIYNEEEQAAILRAEKSISSGKVDQESIEQLANVIKPLEKRLARLYRLRAECAFKNKQYDVAIEDYKAALEYYHTGYVEFSIGRCYYEQTRYYDAIQIFNKALDTIGSDDDEEFFLCSYYKLISLINMKDYARAKPLYQQLSKRWPKNKELAGLAEYFD